MLFSTQEDKARICIGRGPVNFPEKLGLKSGGLFLFNDLLIAAR